MPRPIEIAPRPLNPVCVDIGPAAAPVPLGIPLFSSRLGYRAGRDRGLNATDPEVGLAGALGKQNRSRRSIDDLVEPDARRLPKTDRPFAGSFALARVLVQVSSAKRFE